MPEEITAVRVADSPDLLDRLVPLDDRAPETLWVRGNTGLVTTADRPRLCVTGSRAATGYGMHLAQQLVADAAPHLILTGGGYGIDAAATRAALHAGHPVVVVTAGGVDRAYPTAHAELFDRVVAAGGALVSSTPPASSPNRYRFLKRQELLAALADRVLIVEAGRNSGSLQLAHQAARWGIPVAAVPGPVTSLQSFGTNRLIREGAATLLTDAAQLGDLPLTLPASGTRPRGDLAHTRSIHIEPTLQQWSVIEMIGAESTDQPTFAVDEDGIVRMSLRVDRDDPRSYLITPRGEFSYEAYDERGIWKTFDQDGYPIGHEHPRTDPLDAATPPLQPMLAM